MFFISRGNLTSPMTSTQRARALELLDKDGPVAVAKFDLGEGDEPEQREARALRQREASDVIEQLLARLG